MKAFGMVTLRMSKDSFLKLLVVCAGLTMSAMPLLAQSAGTSSSPSAYSGLTSSSVNVSNSSEIPRFWAGVSGSYLPLKMEVVKSATNATTGEIISSTQANGQAGAGVTLNFRMFSGFWISLGGIYRFGGYDTTDQVNSNTIYLERTRARLLDFPALIRYTGPHLHYLRLTRYQFWEAGAAVRYASDVKLTQAANNGIIYYCCAPPSTTSVKRMIEGVVVGTGVSGKDDFGIVVTPEVRYTRWMGNTFSAPTVATMRNQVEVTVSFGW
jgi:hypothetical protein